jgi:glycosyltransferase involved in cell wall biosynthesis
VKSAIICGGEPLRLAVFYESGAVMGHASSGAGVYELALTNLLGKLRDEFRVEVTFYLPSKLLSGRAQKSNLNGAPVVPYALSFFEKLVTMFPRGPLSRIFAKLGLLRTRKLLRQARTHFAYFASPNAIALALEDVPFITTVWDLGHRDLPGFPEVWAQSRWASRERMYSMTVPRSSFVMVDSAATGLKLELTYGLKPDRWSAIGLLPNVDVASGLAREVPEPYIIYPAMKWPHKNHKTLLEAFAIVLRKLPDLRLVLTGEDGGNGRKIREMVRKLGIQDAVLDFGFVDRKRAVQLIAHAELLAMPSLLGPTNLPPLEALGLGTRVIISTAHDYGRPELEGVLTVPALDVNAWAAAISSSLGPPSLRPIVFDTDGALLAHVTALSRLSLERDCW